MPDQTLSERLDRHSQFGIKLGLENMRGVCAALGHPERCAPAIHVAGTNGKGSVAAAIAAILRAANYPTGCYTSPHLSRVTERITVDNVPVTEAALWRALDAVDRAAAEAGTKLTYFEVLTAAAFHIFKARFVDAAVYEVGLGGRLDATNVVEPAITCVTTIAHDHTRHLGESLTDIAGEKAGIIKPGVPVVCGLMAPESLERIRQVATAAGAPLLVSGEDFGLREAPTPFDDGWQTATWWGRGYADFPFRLPLRGAWQAENAACALAIAHDLIRQGWNLKAPALAAGLERLRWPGRMEWLSESPPVLFDAAHNPAATAAAVATAVQECPAGALPVLAVLADKDGDGICRALAPLGPQVVVTAADHPRALKPDALAEVARTHFPEVIVAPRIDAALERAGQVAPDRPAFVVGSIMNYAEAHASLQRRPVA